MGRELHYREVKIHTRMYFVFLNPVQCFEIAVEIAQKE